MLMSMLLVFLYHDIKISATIKFSWNTAMLIHVQVIVLDTEWSKKPEIFTNWSFIEKFANP